MFMKTIKIAENERVLMYKNEKLEAVLTAGKHRFLDVTNALSFVTFDINSLYFSEKNVTRLFNQSPALQAQVQHWKLEDNETALLYLNDVLRGVVAPGEHLYLWKDAGELRLDRVSLTDSIEVDVHSMAAIKRMGANMLTRLIKSAQTTAVKPIAEFCISQNHIGLLYVDGAFVKRLTPGQHNFWQFFNNVEVKVFDCKTQVLEISGQEILSKDRVSLRINLTASYKVVDAELAAASVDKVDDYIYKTLQLALRESVGTKSLDDILLDKLYVNETVKELVSETLANIGVNLSAVGVKDIILPGEMKTILNQVVEAQKAAEANVIRRREETSATRSLHNTAKVMENNPTLMRLKELEALEKVAERIDSLTVYDGLKGLMNGVVKIAD